jgi:hypothetical protein
MPERRISKMNKGNLQRRLHLVEARALIASTMPSDIRIVFCHASDGRPAGISVFGPDGRLVWLEPPEGSREGELVRETDNLPGIGMAA